MDPLQVVERVLGPVYTWPSYMLHHIFIEDPDDDIILRRVSAFMYCNGIRFQDAWMCFHACNRYGKETVIKEGMKKYYDDPLKLYDTYYYDMFKKKFMYINRNLETYRSTIVLEWLCLGVDNIGVQEEVFKDSVHCLYDRYDYKTNQVYNTGYFDTEECEEKVCTNVMQCAIDKIRAQCKNL
jgi:hypothetical protein